jgi:dTDP-4-dehydrorhamnose 3,5-epimerase
MKKSEIDGVKIKKLVTHLTNDGYFREILRDEDNLMERFGQTSHSVTLPGSIKAFHYHNLQDDLWYILSGQARVVLVDMRKQSPTFESMKELVMGPHDPKLLLIPKGVAHGFQVLGNEPVVLVYHTTQHYNPQDEVRIPYDDKKIGFDWSIKHE